LIVTNIVLFCQSKVPPVVLETAAAVPLACPGEYQVLSDPVVPVEAMKALSVELLKTISMRPSSTNWP
jgi:hypothetical protein